MQHFIETKVKYEKTMENGMQKKVTEPYLVDALSFTEAESRIIEEITPFMSGEFTVSAVKKSNITEIFWNDSESADKWFKVKVNFIIINEKTMQEKKTASYMLVQAADLRSALKSFDESMKGIMADYQIASIAETPLMDVYKADLSKSPETEIKKADGC